MTFNELAKRNDLQAAFCVEFDTGSDVIHFADTLVREADYKWLPKVKRLSRITRSADPERRMFEIPPVSITLNNDGMDTHGVGELSSLLKNNNEFRSSTATIYLAIVDPGDGLVKKQKVFSGVPRPRKFGREVKMELWPSIWRRVGLIQQTVNLKAFPKAKKSDVGAGCNIFLANGATAGVNGQARCPVVDTTTRRLMVMQHYAFVVGAIWRERSGQRTIVTPSATGTDLDGEGNRYMYAEIAAIDYHVDDTWWVDSFPMTSYPSGGIATWANPITAIRQMLLLFTDVASDDLGTSWGAAETEYAGRGSYSAWEWGYLLPRQAFEIEAENRKDQGWGILAELLSGTGYTGYVSSDGKIEIGLLHPWDASASTAHYSERRDHFLGIPETDIEPFGILTDADLFYSSAQLGGSEASRHFENAISRGQYGTHRGTMRADGVRLTNLAGDIGTWEMQLKSGAYHMVHWSLPGALGLQDGSDIGQTVTLTHRALYGQQVEQEVLVTEVSIDPGSKSTHMAGITCGPPVGTVVVS